MSPGDMPSVGTPLVMVKRVRDAIVQPGECCAGCSGRNEERVEFVPALKRGPRTIRNTALADALVAAGIR
jgi:hypothetical protein